MYFSTSRTYEYTFMVSGLIISLVILIPVVFMGSQALTAIETLAGLEGKMTGSVGIDPSKSS